MTANEMTIYIDGGSRGNPGPAALGVVFSRKSGDVLKTYSQCLGESTNNEAEYAALIFALKKAKALLGKEKIKGLLLEIRSDSELLVRQMKGEYKVLDEKIQKLFLQAWNLKIDFRALQFVLVPREENKMADRLVNEALDAPSKSPKLF
jgi:ribonuclease HI